MGTEGSAHLKAYAEDGLLICSEKKGRYSPELPGSSKAGFVEQMISAYEANEENSVSTQDVLSVSKTCLAAVRSAKSGGELIQLSED